MHSIPASDANPRQHAPDYLDLARLLAFEPTASSAGSFKSGLTLQSQPGSNTLLPVNGSPVWSSQPCALFLAKNQICRVGSNHHGIETSFALGMTMPSPTRLGMASLVSWALCLGISLVTVCPQG